MEVFNQSLPPNHGKIWLVWYSDLLHAGHHSALPCSYQFLMQRWFICFIHRSGHLTFLLESRKKHSALIGKVDLFSSAGVVFSQWILQFLFSLLGSIKSLSGSGWKDKKFFFRVKPPLSDGSLTPFSGELAPVLVCEHSPRPQHHNSPLGLWFLLWVKLKGVQ